MQTTLSFLEKTLSTRGLLADLKKTPQTRSQDRVASQFRDFIENTPTYGFEDQDSELTELNLAEELDKKLGSFDRIKRNLSNEGSYSRMYRERRAKREKNPKKQHDSSLIEFEETERENNRVLQAFSADFENSETSKTLQRDVILDEKETSQSLQDLYLKHSGKIIMLQRFLRARYGGRKPDEGPSSCFRMDKLLEENLMLKKENSKLKSEKKALMLEMVRKTRIEKGLDEQKREISEVIQKYSSFIEKLMQDKKDLSLKCEHFSQKIIEKESEFSKYRVWAQEQLDGKTAELTGSLKNSQRKKEYEDELERLRNENSEMRQNHEAEIEALKAKYQLEYLGVETKFRESIAKKDETIRKLNLLIVQMRRNLEDSKENTQVKASC